MKKIAVLLTCYNRRELTIKCLEHLYACDLPLEHELEVFLVDDGSTDGTSDVVITAFPKVNIITGDGNLFWNRGMHLAWTSALSTDNYDFFLWLNDDTILFDNAIIQLLNTYYSSSNEAIVCSSICSAAGEVCTYGGFKDSMLVVPNGNIQFCDYFNGNCVLISYLVYSKLGTVDPFFHHSLGDFDYGKRAKAMSINILATASFVGYCEKHTNYPKWCSPDVKFVKRFSFLYKSSCDTNPFQFFRYDKRHNGLISAIFHFFTINLRTAIPQLYNKRKSI